MLSRSPTSWTAVIGWRGIDRGGPGAENPGGGRTLAGDGRLPKHRRSAREGALSGLLLALQVILSVTLLVAAIEKTLRAEEFFAALRLSYLPPS